MSFLRIVMPLIVILIFAFFYYAEEDTLYSIDGYPVWMIESDSIRTDQTSGLFFTGEKDGKKCFISCDDNGAVHRLTVEERISPPVIRIDSIHFSLSAYNAIKDFAKKDFEEIFFDSKENSVFIFAEGSEFNKNDPFKFKEVEGLYELKFNKDIYTFDTITSIKKISLPQKLFAHTLDNISFEGVAFTENYFFFGLENYQTEREVFTDSTLLFVYNRHNGDLIEINTRELRIATICGLFAEDDHTLYGVDRNSRRAFLIRFNDDFSVRDVRLKELELSIPGHKNIDMILGTSPESITLDGSDNIYIAVDPWSKFYMPDQRDMRQLSEKEISYFTRIIPILYKFKNTF